MLSILKKSSEKSSGAVLHAWRPNFRNFDLLPDIKVVRTTFFVNGIAVLITAVIFVYAVYREVSLNTLKQDAKVSQDLVKTNKPQSDLAIVQYKQFQEQEKKITELAQFYSVSRIKLSEFITSLGETLVPAITVASIDYKPDGVTFRGSVKGSSEEAAGLAQTYVDNLRKTVYFSALFDSITLSSIARDTNGGEIKFEINLRFGKSAAKPLGVKK